MVAEQVTPRNAQWWRLEAEDELRFSPVGSHIRRRTCWAAGGSAARKESRMAVVEPSTAKVLDVPGDPVLGSGCLESGNQGQFQPLELGVSSDFLPPVSWCATSGESTSCLSYIQTSFMCYGNLELKR